MSFKTRFPELYQALLPASSTRSGLSPKSPADATKFLNGATAPAYVAVKDSDLSTSDVLTNNVDTTKHGFAPKGSTDTAKFLRADASYAVAFPQITQGRLTLTSGSPVTTADVTGATNIYFSPYGGNRVALYTSSLWQLYTFSELTLAVGTLTNDLPYDVFLYDNASVLTLESVAWSSKTARSTALVLQDGVLVKSGSTNKKYLGTFHTTSTTTTEDSFAKRLLWNYYNRMRRGLRVIDTTDTWSYTTASYRQANASTANQLAVVVGVAETLIEAEVRASASNTSTLVYQLVAIGEDSTTTKATECLNGYMETQSATGINNASATLRKYPAIGYHFYAWLEQSNSVGTTTWYGDNAGTTINTGITGSIDG